MRTLVAIVWVPVACALRPQAPDCVAAWWPVWLAAGAILWWVLT